MPQHRKFSRDDKSKTSTEARRADSTTNKSSLNYNVCQLRNQATLGHIVPWIKASIVAKFCRQLHRAHAPDPEASRAHVELSWQSSDTQGRCPITFEP